MDFRNVKQPFGWMKTMSDLAGALTRLGFLGILFKYIYVFRPFIINVKGTPEWAINVLWISSLTIVALIFLALAISLLFLVIEVGMALTVMIASSVKNEVVRQVIAVVVTTVLVLLIFSFVFVLFLAVNQSTGFLPLSPAFAPDGSQRS